jgi:hypothetical protein
VIRVAGPGELPKDQLTHLDLEDLPTVKTLVSGA